MKQSIRADFRQDRQAAKERAAARKAAVSTIDEIKNADDPIDKAFELWVPSSGKSDNKAGELVRAMMKLLYRDYNDGDVFYEGYGIETCADAVAYLCKYVPGVEGLFEVSALHQEQGDAYTERLQEISAKVLDYIYKNPNLIWEENDEDYQDFDGEEFIESNEWEPKYEYDCSLPDSIVYHLDKGDISTRDIEQEVGSWEYFRDAVVQVDYGSVYVEDLDREAYDEIEDGMYAWLESWGEDLDSEYGSEEDEYEEEYDEED